MIQWGIAQNTAASNPIQFPISFSNTNYVITGTLIGRSTNACVVWENERKTVSSIPVDFAYSIDVDNKGGYWIAIGF